MGGGSDGVTRRGAENRREGVGTGMRGVLVTCLSGNGFTHIMAALSLSALPSHPCAGSGGDEGVREVGGALHA